MQTHSFRDGLGAVWPMLLATAGFLLIGLFGGCASVSVKKGSEAAVAHKPDRIYVQEFSTREGLWNVDREGAELVEFQRTTRASLANETLDRVAKHLAPTLPAAAAVNPLPRQNAWLVTGRFVRVNQGSRFLRAAVGLGSGGTKLETEVAVYDLNDEGPLKPFLTFSTTGGSGAQAGAIFGGPMGAAPNAVGGAVVGLTNDIVRTSREITGALSDYMFARGWITDDGRVKAKYIGQFPF